MLHTTVRLQRRPSPGSEASIRAQGYYIQGRTTLPYRGYEISLSTATVPASVVIMNNIGDTKPIHDWPFTASAEGIKEAMAYIDGLISLEETQAKDGKTERVEEDPFIASLCRPDIGDGV
ncbi:hypothetical protein KAJ83_01500 [Marivibrio halodurans]|uniref:Uncharacterized protein n=1 Tax=Marivibrio halodurans TaxID=2039722 RepID=A0A8J7S4W4_9PROT|nr:hypothetical protein [Marivibrio halodurans]MBP5855667.1 hypothetical protein [Marivibrio halodurans]